MRAFPRPMMESIFGRAPGTFGRDCGVKFGPAILGEQGTVKMTPEINIDKPGPLVQTVARHGATPASQHAQYH